MKKIVIVSALVLGIIILTSAILNATYFLKRVKSATPANEPTLKKGESFYISKLVEPKLFDFVCFYNSPNHEQMVTFRLCGLEGDTVELKEGDLFLNSVEVDKNLNLKHDYLVKFDDLDYLRKSTDINEDEIRQIHLDTFAVALRDKVISTLKIHVSKYKSTYTEGIKNNYGQDWTADNFGPIVIPLGKCFLLGDNRHNCLDSRFLGFIKKSDLIATVIAVK